VQGSRGLMISTRSLPVEEQPVEGPPELQGPPPRSQLGGVRPDARSTGRPDDLVHPGDDLGVATAGRRTARRAATLLGRGHRDGADPAGAVQAAVAADRGPAALHLQAPRAGAERARPYDPLETRRRPTGRAAPTPDDRAGAPHRGRHWSRHRRPRPVGGSEVGRTGKAWLEEAPHRRGRIGARARR